MAVSAEERTRKAGGPTDEEHSATVLSDVAPVGLGLLDQTRRFVRVNPALALLTGHAQDAIPGRSIDELLPGAGSLVSAVLSGELGRDGPAAATLTGVGPNRTAVWLVQASRIRGDRDTPTGVSVAVTPLPLPASAAAIDVEARRRQIEQQAILDSVPAMIWYKDRQNRILRCNRPAAESMGITVEQMEGRSTEEFYPADAEKYHRDDLEVIDRGEPKLGIVEPYRLPDGQQRWVRTDKVPFRDARGNAVGVLVFALDVTSLKEAELERERLMEALEAERALLEGVLRQLPVGVLVAAVPKGGLLLANERASKIFGGPFPMLGAYEEYSRFSGFHPDGQPVRWDEWPLSRSLLAGEVVSGEELGIFRADGAPITLRIWSTPIQDRRGRPTAAVVIFYDVTAEKRAEEERGRLYREAQEAVRARDEFLSMASHELKTPLTALQLQVQSLLRTCSGEASRTLTPEVLQRKLAVVQKQVERLVKLIGDLLDITRINAGRISLTLERLDLREVVQDVADRARESLGRSRCTLSLRLPERPVMGCWDRLRLDQIVTNLLSNAVKYGPGRPVEVAVEPRDGQARLTVRDHGIGIASEDQARIFDRFERAVSDRHYGGLGLGLWIVQRMTRVLGGTVEVASHVGEGSTFTVLLPAERPTPLEEQPSRTERSRAHP